VCEGGVVENEVVKGINMKKTFAAVLAAALYGCGCATSQPTERYPFPIMLDPVTEVTPNAHVK
jgi:hypothetical protein